MARAASTMPGDRSVTCTSSTHPGLLEVEREEARARAELERRHRTASPSRPAIGDEPVTGVVDAPLVEGDRPLLVVRPRLPVVVEHLGQLGVVQRTPDVVGARHADGHLSTHRLIALEARPCPDRARRTRSTPISRSRVANRPANCIRSISRPVSRSTSTPRSMASFAARRANAGPPTYALDAAAGRRQHVRGVDDLVDQPDPQRLVGGHEPAAEDQLLGPGGTDQAGQPLGAARPGDEPEQDLRLAEAGRCRRPPGSRRPGRARTRRPGRSR